MACKKTGIPFVSTIDEYRKHKDEKGLYFELDRHMTAAGHKLYADIVTPYVTKNVEALSKKSTS